MTVTTKILYYLSKLATNQNWNVSCGTSFNINTSFFVFCIFLLDFCSRTKDGNNYNEIDLSTNEADSSIDENVIDLDTINIRQVFQSIKKNVKLNYVSPVVHPIVIKIKSKILRCKNKKNLFALRFPGKLWNMTKVFSNQLFLSVLFTRKKNRFKF
jgi:hypothetical protein